jgi:hypothetical protein
MYNDSLVLMLDLEDGANELSSSDGSLWNNISGLWHLNETSGSVIDSSGLIMVQRKVRAAYLAMDIILTDQAVMLTWEQPALLTLLEILRFPYGSMHIAYLIINS